MLFPRGSEDNSSASTSPLLSPNPRPTARTMEEVWRDINLSSLHDDPSTDIPATEAFHGVVLQDFLARPAGKEAPLTVSAAYASPSPSPATALSLNSNNPPFHFLANSDPHRLRPDLLGQSHPISNGCSLHVPFDALAASSSLSALGKKRFHESDNNSGDRRRKRMIKNRESAARSRARKQAYTNELELEVAHLMEENARLRKQQRQLCLAAAAQPPKKKSLLRASTAPF